MKPTFTKPVMGKADTALSFAQGHKPSDTGRVFHAPEGYRRLTINLPEKLHKKLRFAAVEDDCTATDIVVRLLERELGE